MQPFDSKLEEAIHILWVDFQFERGQEAFEIIEEKAKAGNGDAYYFLARCYAGSCFVNRGFGFPEDDDKCEEYMNLSIESGSAIGMFGARRLGGFKPRCGSFLHAPYHSSRELWDSVCNIAASGEIFTQYLIANAYYYGDVGELLEIDFRQVKEPQLQQLFRQWAEAAIPLYEDLIAHGMYMGVGNYIDIITSGDYGVPKNEKRARELKYLAAEHGMTPYQIEIGREYMESDPQKAEAYFQKAIDGNNMSGCYYLGTLYTFDGRLGKNLAKAKDLFERALQADAETTGCHNRLGEIYFYGGDGIAPDYNVAFKHLQAAHFDENNWGSDMLGTCYLKGLGTSVDYRRAKEEFEHYPGEALSAIGLGEIYAYGLGVPADIKKAMDYWNSFPQHPRVIENKKNFKRTLFGWKRLS